VVAAEDAVLFGGNIIPSVQPTHATSDMYWAKERLGEARINRAYAYKTLLGHAGRLALGTDFPVEEVNPFLTFYAAVTRQDVSGFPEGGYHYNEALSREQALRGMTIWAAFSNFEEAEKGSIEPGKWADFLILSDDIMEVDAAAIPHLTAESVFIGGEEVN
jgi:predicted amidohydrolase YtcJ